MLFFHKLFTAVERVLKKFPRFRSLVTRAYPDVSFFFFFNPSPPRRALPNYCARGRSVRFSYTILLPRDSVTDARSVSFTEITVGWGRRVTFFDEKTTGTDDNIYVERRNEKRGKGDTFFTTSIDRPEYLDFFF